MSEFRTGNKGKSHPYPTTPRAGAAAASAFARNFAIGPGTAQAVTTTGTQINWSLIDAGATTGVNVAITPRSTGAIRISGVVALTNASVNANTVTVQIQINGVTQAVPAPQATTGEAGEGGIESIPFEYVFKTLPIGVTGNVQILVTTTADGEITLNINDCTVEVQEVAAATG